VFIFELVLTNCVELQSFLLFALLLLLALIKDIKCGLDVTGLVSANIFTKCIPYLSITAYRRVVVLVELVKVIWILFIASNLDLRGKVVPRLRPELERPVRSDLTRALYVLLHSG
jgi:hypothetical protein